MEDFAMSAKPPKKNVSKYLGIVFVLVAVVGLGFSVFQSQQTQTINSQAKGRPSSIAINLQSAASSLDVGETATVDVVLETRGTPVAGVDLVITYPDDTVQVTGITPGSFLPTVLVEGAVLPGIAKITLGSKVEAPQTGSGTIAQLTVKALQKTNTAVITVSPETQAASPQSSEPLDVQEGQLRLRVR